MDEEFSAEVPQHLADPEYYLVYRLVEPHTPLVQLGRVVHQLDAEQNERGRNGDPPDTTVPKEVEEPQ
jgi:hypothetical protein